MQAVQSVDMVTQLACAISEYGVQAVIMAIFLVIFLAIQFLMYKQIINHNKISDDIIKSSLERNQKLMDMIIHKQVECSNNTINEEYVKREQALIEVCVKVNSRLKSECKLIANKLLADRVAIYVFHNGAFSISGSPFFKFSCICEHIALGSGIRSQLLAHNNLPINLLEDAIDALWKDGNTAYFANDQDSTVLGKVLFQDDKKQVSLLYTIYNADGRPLGFIMADYANPDITLDELHEKKAILKEFSEKVSPILELSAYRREKLKK